MGPCGSIVKRMSWVSCVLFCLTLGFGCATTKVNVEQLPPVLSQDELLRPYDKVASIEVRRERYGSIQDLTPEDYTWAYHSLRQEAARVGADAVIVPEIRIVTQTYTVFPTSEVRAKGTAIKFR